MNMKIYLLLISLFSVLDLSAQDSAEIINAKKQKDEGNYLEASVCTIIIESIMA